jgi:DNA-binding HxlR family transcriptional regulator
VTGAKSAGGLRVLDILSRPRALRTLVEIAKKEPMTMREFMVASAYHNEGAQDLRDDLEKAGMITVATHHKGRVGHKEIRLTEEGRRVVELCKQIETVAEEAQKRAPKKPSD